MTMTLAAVQAAVSTATAAGKQATITTADYVFTGTVRYADSDHRRLVVFMPVPGSYVDSDGERLVDANGAAFRIGYPQFSHDVAHGNIAYDWPTTPQRLTHSATTPNRGRGTPRPPTTPTPSPRSPSDTPTSRPRPEPSTST